MAINFNNNILFKAKIVKGKGWKVSQDIKGEAFTAPGNGGMLKQAIKGENVGQADIIDINNNNKADTESYSRGNEKVRKYTEPKLSVPYKKIKEIAKEKNLQVITQDDLKDVNITYDENYGISTEFDDGKARPYQGGYSPGYKEREPNTLVTPQGGTDRSLSKITKDILPQVKDAKWAIDINSQEFIIYK